jgi:hypothetical protein
MQPWRARAALAALAAGSVTGTVRPGPPTVREA